MKRFILNLAVISLIFVSGCGAWVNANISPINNKEIPSKYEKNYVLGKATTAYIGQDIIRVKEYNGNRFKKIQLAVAPEDIYIQAKYKTTNYKININANDKYKIEAVVEKDNKLFNVIRLRDNYNYEWGALLDEKGKLEKTCLYSYNYSMLYCPESPVTANDYTFSIQDSSADITAAVIQNMEFIYSGKNDVSLNATYKEYTSDNLARPAFFQNLTYQANAKQIRFKDFVIQIHSVTNEHINYTVIADGLNE